MTLEKNCNEKIIINIDDLSKGLYFFKIQKVNTTHKIIKN